MKYQRLKKNADFQKLFKKGKRVFSRTLTVIYSPAKEKTVMG
ncbi:MAG: ribonuclease P protein component, partial [Clostridia bacterium]|nr:ribonuclease P protein component [Clostridia bacterium]